LTSADLILIRYLRLSAQTRCAGPLASCRLSSESTSPHFSSQRFP